MSNWKSMIVAGSVLLGGCTSGIYVQGPSGRSAASMPSLTATATAGISVSLSADQIAAVRGWYGESRRQNRGRGRGNGLPPGIARNLARGKSLPPGIEKQYLPQNLLVQLPRVDDGLDYIVAAGKLLLVDAATQVVRDVLLDAVFD